MSFSINHETGAKRPYHGQRVCVEWQSPHFCRSTDRTSTGIKACSSSSVDGASVATVVVARGLPNGCQRARTGESTTKTARTARTTLRRFTLSPPVRSQRWREGCPVSRSSRWSLLKHSPVVQPASPLALHAGPNPAPVVGTPWTTQYGNSHGAPLSARSGGCARPKPCPNKIASTTRAPAPHRPSPSPTADRSSREECARKEQSASKRKVQKHLSSSTQVVAVQDLPTNPARSE